MKILAVDPGGVTGWAYFYSAKLHSFGSVDSRKGSASRFWEWLVDMANDELPDVIVCESYIIRPPKSGGFDHSFSKGETLQYIGALKFFAHCHGIKFVEQPSAIKVPASGMAFGVKYKTGKKDLQHHYDAVLHGAYYLMTKLKFQRSDFGTVE